MGMSEDATYFTTKSEFELMKTWTYVERVVGMMSDFIALKCF